MKLFVLAGGFGTRLQSVLSGTPKALANIEGVPFLALQLENWVSQGVQSFVFLLHHQAEDIIDFLSAVEGTLLRGCEVVTLVEPEPLGTGGAVGYAVTELGLEEDFLVVNADTWLGSGIRMLEMSCAPAIAVVHLDNVDRYGVVEIEHQDRVAAFKEKNAKGSSGWINAGLCRLSAETFRNWDGSSISLEKQIFPHLASSGKLSAVPITADFIDIGIPEDYQKFCKWSKQGRKGAF